MKAPPASSPAVRRSMQGNRRRDTRPEVLLRRELRRLGRTGYRVDHPVDVTKGLERFMEQAGLTAYPFQRRRLTVRPDLVFVGARLAVFLHGCYWHGCEDHYVEPRTNAGYWGPKIARNRERDRETALLLEAAGWRVLTVWEHEAPQEAAQRVLGALREARRAA